MNRPLRTFALAAALAAALFGCGGDDDKPSVEPGGSGGGSGAPATSAGGNAGNSADGGVTNQPNGTGGSGGAGAPGAGAPAVTPVAGASGGGGGGSADMIFPGAEWEQAAPGELDVDAAKLDAALAFLAQKALNSVSDVSIDEVMIIRRGYVIHQGSKVDREHNIWSATKSFTSTVLGLLVEDGKATLDTAARDHLPSLPSSYSALTLRRFATMTSGYWAEGDTTTSHTNSNTPFQPKSEPLFSPGTKFLYYDSAMNQFARVLTAIAQEPIEALLLVVSLSRSAWLPMSGTGKTGARSTA